MIEDALAYVVRAEETVNLDRLATSRKIEHISKYLQDNGSQASLCWRRVTNMERGKAGKVEWCHIVIGGISVN